MPGHLFDSAEAAIIKSCPKHSLNEIRAAAAFNAFSAVLSACLMESSIVLITGIAKSHKHIQDSDRPRSILAGVLRKEGEWTSICCQPEPAQA